MVIIIILSLNVYMYPFMFYTCLCVCPVLRLYFSYSLTKIPNRHAGQRVRGLVEWGVGAAPRGCTTWLEAHFASDQLMHKHNGSDPGMDAIRRFPQLLLMSLSYKTFPLLLPSSLSFFCFKHSSQTPNFSFPAFSLCTFLAWCLSSHLPFLFDFEIPLSSFNGLQ